MKVLISLVVTTAKRATHSADAGLKNLSEFAATNGFERTQTLLTSGRSPASSARRILPIGRWAILGAGLRSEAAGGAQLLGRQHSAMVTVEIAEEGAGRTLVWAGSSS
jgi:hypothetical protein